MMTDHMMLQESANVRQGLNCGMLIAALIVLAQDLSSRGGAQAWTYHYRVSPESDWRTGRQWCQQHFTDIVAIQNQEETDYLNDFLPFHPRYYWIGLYREKRGEWTWVGTGKMESKNNPNWATAEPDKYRGHDCVEMYIKRVKDSGKWNNEKCNKAKGIVCYTVSCKQDSCSAHADCVETIGNYTCQCHPGFMGPRCEEAISCGPLPDQEHASRNCTRPFGPNHFNTSCRFNCGLGFRLVGVPQLLCQANGSWDHPVPLCQVEQCPVLNRTSISGGNVKCSHPIAPYSYNSTCELRCDKGYGLSGQDHLRCEHTGQWTPPVPTCTVTKCPRISFPAVGNMTCVDTVEPFSYGSECNFTCQEGFYLAGMNTTTCLASGQWSTPTPACEVVQCSSLKIPPHASMQCQESLSVYIYGSICTVQCDEGFDLIGTNTTRCLSQGDWSHALPVCQAKRCPTLDPPPHGVLICSDPNGALSFASQCRTTCEEGFLINGTADTECTSTGTWTTDIPSCLVRTCPPLKSPTHGSIACSDPHGVFSFASRCNSTCEEGFILNGTAETECTSVGTWSTVIPHCLAKTCPTLKSPAHGIIECSNPHGVFSFGSRCNSTCEEGFVLNGTSETECTSVGVWSTEIPRCHARSCPLLVEAQHQKMNCSHPHSSFSYGSHCDFKCNEGFQLRGTPTIACNASGNWSQALPTCQPKRCPTLNAPAHGSFACSDPHGAFSFGSQCTFSCEEGFVLNGTADTECTDVDSWSRGTPDCLARPCPLLATAPQHGRMSCKHANSPFSYGSLCDFECNEGFWLSGASALTCSTLGHWSQDLPTCKPVLCEAFDALSLPLSMNCSHPLGNFSSGSQCLFTCRDGFFLNGSEVLLCSSAGFWSDTLPVCTAEGMPFGTGMLLYTSAGAASAVLPLALIGLALLIVKRRWKKRRESEMIISYTPASEAKDNPTFEF